jgi:hypothetical protein
MMKTLLEILIILNSSQTLNANGILLFIFIEIALIFEAALHWKLS